MGLESIRENKNKKINIETELTKKFSDKSSIIKDVLYNIKSNQEEKFFLSEKDEVFLAQKQINWIRELLYADSLSIEEDKYSRSIKKRVKDEIQSSVLKYKKKDETESQALGRLKSGVESGFNITKHLLKNLKQNEDLYFNSRLDAFSAIDLVKVMWSEDLLNMEQVILIQIKNKLPSKKEIEEIKEKLSKYKENSYKNFERRNNEVEKSLFLHEENLHSKSVSEVLYNIIDDNSFIKNYKNMNDTHKSIIERLAVDLFFVNVDNIKQRIIDIYNNNVPGSSEFIQGNESDIINNLRPIFDSLKSKEQIQKYISDDVNFVKNNIFSVNSIKSTIMYLDRDKIKEIYID